MRSSCRSRAKLKRKPLEEPVVKSVESGRHQHESAEPTDEYGQPEPEWTHSGSTGQQRDSVERREADNSGDEDDRESPPFLADQVKQFCHHNPEARPGRPDGALFLELPAMPDEGQLLAFADAEKEQQLANSLADGDANRDRNGSDDR